ncbi:MAG: ABC-type transport system involved in multi-copper enzyme maturation permease subunit [Pirellulaceae bacterium]|jgi:ABC-type transport system involved in multi-copper enzyme maturation permease subunit
MQEFWYNWLTPLWILSVGVFLGLIAVAAFGGACWLLSRIPQLNTLFYDKKPIAQIAGGVLAFLLLAAIGSRLPRTDDDQISQTAVMWLLASAPLFWATGYGIIALISKRAVAEFKVALLEGFLWPTALILGGFGSFAVMGYFLVSQPDATLNSLKRLPYVGTTTYTFEIPVSEDKLGLPEETPIEVRFSGKEIRHITFETTQQIGINLAPNSESVRSPFDINAHEKIAWVKGGRTPNPFKDNEIETLYVRNFGEEAAQVKLTTFTAPEHSQVMGIPVTAICVFATFFIYMLVRFLLPKVSAIALATYKSEIVQPLFMIVLFLGIVAIVTFIFVPYYTLGEDIKLLKESGLTLIMILCIIQAVWAAGTSIAEEIDGKTALTVLSKPIGRRDFIIGKFVGIAWTVSLLFLVLGMVLLICVAYKPIYDYGEGSPTEPTWAICYLEMASTVPGLALGLMETLVLAALSVCISTRLPMLANFILSFGIYWLGHLTPLLIQSSDEDVFPVVRFFGQLIATIVPNLDHFNIHAAIANGVSVPLSYLGVTFAYSVIYSVIALLLALVLFEDRDLS